MPQNISLSKVINPASGWYRGDFHAHTTFSDGYYDPLELVDVARAEGLDFLSITDHNTIAALSDFDPPADILVIPGMEVTLKEGHYNALGIERYRDWMEYIIATGPGTTTLQERAETITGLMEQAATTGVLNSINHPLLEPWAWLDENTDLRCLQCLEIWNDPSWPDNVRANPEAVALWTAWLNAGYRITAIGGTDYHRPQPKPGENKPPERLSLPSTYVFAEQLSGAAILAGLRQRQAYVSLGPRVTFEAEAGGTSYGIGADLGDLSGPIEFRATLSHSQVATHIHLIRNGNMIAEVSVQRESGRLQYSDQVDSTRPAWYRLDVFGQDGEILVVTNPIFVGSWPEPTAWTYGAFVERQP